MDGFEALWMVTNQVMVEGYGTNNLKINEKYRDIEANGLRKEIVRLGNEMKNLELDFEEGTFKEALNYLESFKNEAEFEQFMDQYFVFYDKGKYKEAIEMD